MKWIKTAIGAVIAVISIGIIATIVYKMAQPSEVIKEVCFEINYDEYEYEHKYYPISIYNEIFEYAVIEEDTGVPNMVVVSNIVSVYVNNDGIDDFAMSIPYYVSTDEYGYPVFSGYIDGVIGFAYVIYPDGNLSATGVLKDDVNIKLVFAVPQPPQLSGNSAVLILLVPIVFVGGVVLFYYKPFKKD